MHNPLEIFKNNWAQAKSLHDGNAGFCTLATVSETGQASLRTLVLREVTEDSIIIFINESSPKWNQLKATGQFELLVFWPSLMQQYRIRGECLTLPLETMKNHWAKKPYDAKIIDHFYREYQPQSSIIDSRERLISGIQQLKKKFPVQADIPFSENAKGAAIKATTVETWFNSSEDRLHERVLYSLVGGEWDRKLLVP